MATPEDEKKPDQIKDLVLKNKVSTAIGLVIGLLIGLSKVPALSQYSEMLNAFAGALGLALGFFSKDANK